MCLTQVPKYSYCSLMRPSGSLRKGRHAAGWRLPVRSGPHGGARWSPHGSRTRPPGGGRVPLPTARREAAGTSPPQALCLTVRSAARLALPWPAISAMARLAQVPGTRFRRSERTDQMTGGRCGRAPRRLDLKPARDRRHDGRHAGRVRAGYPSCERARRGRIGAG